MKPDFESAKEEIKNIFPQIKEILVAILYGSVARGDYSERHSDLDLFIILKNKAIDEKTTDKINNLIIPICAKHGVKAHLEFQGTKIKDEDISLIRKIIEEGKIIYSSGIWTFDEKQIGLKQHIIYSFYTKEAKNRTMFSKALHGRKSWYYKNDKKVVKTYPGIINSEGITNISRGGLLVAKEKQKDIEDMFNHFNVSYKINRIVYA